MTLKPSRGTWTRNFTRLYALIMAIDVYESAEFRRLSSAISDALRFKKYLTDRLDVPESQIRMLIGSDASRFNIIDALKKFQDDPRIETGDPILIFYAGHGNEISAPPGWVDDRQPFILENYCPTPGREGPFIQALVPQNYCPTRGLEVPCIPDRTVGALLKAIAKKKGNNITVVLDCCHSASGTRGPGGRFRSGTKPSLICTEDLDRDIWGVDEEILYPALQFQHEGLLSHTLIAACGPSELAAECDKFGNFSNAFLDLLNAMPPDEIRYSQLLKLMNPIKGQNPQIEGVNLDRFLFNAAPPTPLPPAHHDIFFDEESDSHLILVGTAHSVTEGTVFDIKADSSPNATHIGTATVEKSMPFCSIVKSCKNDHVLPRTLESTLILVERRQGVRPHPLCLYIAHEGNHEAKYQDSYQYISSLLNNVKYNLHHVVLVDQQKAHFKVSVNKKTVTFHLLDKRLGHHKHFFRLPRSSIATVVSAMQTAADCRWELERTNEDDSDTMDDIDVSIYSLEERPVSFADGDTVMEMMPVDDKDLCENDELDIVVQRERHLGFKITNTGDRGVYPVLQYFDFSDLGKMITLYQPPTSGPSYVPEAPLKKDDGFLTVGYGAGGMPPLTLSLQRSQDVAVGYLKLSVFTQPLDFGLAGTRLHQNRQQQQWQQRGDRQEDTWATRIIPVIQRRHPVRTPVTPKTPSSSRWPSAPALNSFQTYPEAMVNRSISTPAGSKTVRLM